METTAQHLSRTLAYAAEVVAANVGTDRKVVLAVSYAGPVHPAMPATVLRARITLTDAGDLVSASVSTYRVGSPDLVSLTPYRRGEEAALVARLERSLKARAIAHHSR